MRPVVYTVENLRDGTSFSTRLVHAVQNGEVIFTATVSYHKHEMALTSHQCRMPKVPPPESLMSYEDLLSQALM
jgi:acyl-CoA thioesterase II